MRRAGFLAAAALVLAGMGHNNPPAPVSAPTETVRAVLPKRIEDENRRNQKLKQKLRRQKRRDFLNRYPRAMRKRIKFGPGYRPGKLFKGHRI